ncbi:MAG: hypothetical protein HQK76_06610 [Desulfobacterales bacterium]|nr:hypothetical protein [Desulfobacterales bacterium]
MEEKGINFQNDVDNVLKNIDPEIFKTFSPIQISEIKKAIYPHVSKKKKKHAVDVRGTIPLIFIRLYFVILVGIDQRSSSMKIKADRRLKPSIIGNIIFLIFFLIFMAGFAFIFVNIYNKWY